MCRIGNLQLLDILEDISTGKAEMEDLELLHNWRRYQGWFALWLGVQLLILFLPRYATFVMNMKRISWRDAAQHEYVRNSSPTIFFRISVRGAANIVCWFVLLKQLEAEREK